eukprot:767949-Hanusia_phi.AAC.2
MSQALVGEGKKRTAEDIDKLLRFLLSTTLIVVRYDCRANLDEFSESSVKHLIYHRSTQSLSDLRHVEDSREGAPGGRASVGNAVDADV